MSSSGRGASTDSTAAKIGSGMSTMPAPPPNGASSTALWRPAASLRRSWALISMSSFCCALPSSDSPTKLSISEGNTVNTSIRMLTSLDCVAGSSRLIGIDGVEQPIRQIDHDHAIISPFHIEREWDEPVAFKHQNIAGWILEHRLDQA